MISHEPFVVVEPLYTTMSIDASKALLLSSLQPPLLPKSEYIDNGYPYPSSPVNSTKCCARFVKEHPILLIKYSVKLLKVLN